MLERVMGKVKVLLGVKDSIQDEPIEVIIEIVASHLAGLLEKEIPTKLDYIVIEISVRRYQRLGSEGMKSESVEGHAVTYHDLKDEFVPYWDVIEPEIVPKEVKRSKVRFI